MIFEKQLPPGWSWARVDEVGEVRLGRQRAPEHHTGTHMRPYLRVANVFEDRIDTSDVFEMNFTPEEYERYKLLPGDILLNEGQSRELVGRPAIYRDEMPGACFQNTLIRFRARQSVIPEFALLVFRTYLHSGRFQSISKWTTSIAHLGADRFASLEFPVPPLAEQRRIVSKLEALLSRSRLAKEALDAIPALLERFRQAVLAAAFRGALTERWRSQTRKTKPTSDLLEQIRAERRRRWEDVVQERLRLKAKTPKAESWKTEYDEPTLRIDPDAPKAEWFGDLDSLGWNAAPLELLADPVRGIPYGIVITGDPHPTGVPTVRCGDIKNFSIELDPLKRVNPEIASQYSRTRLEGGEVLVAIRGTVGGVAVASLAMAGMNISREVAMVPSLPGVQPRFLMYLLASPVAVRILAGHTKGVAQSGVNLDDLRSFPVPLPSTAEQNEIVKFIEQAFARISTVHERWKQASEQLDLLNESMLSRAFCGELVPQDPNDEPASVLLERIRAEREAAASSPKQRRSTKATGRKSATGNPT
ncbi:restriction endonuclease subunit S [Pyxidicoccus trucidator]|uniref:restriction endonuclease subunit S n=1 Tax=Pyxidicoccus trucidator TaxID=2709662 RepID=UPI0013D9A1EB|nr:restriction endonuclease subunit S [Pyxidicoccus trucidator]